MATSSSARGVIQPAPGELELIQAFVNTNDIDANRDTLSSKNLLSTWLIEHDLLHKDEFVTDEDLQRVQDLREALRVLLLANNGVELDEYTPKLLSRLVESASLLIQFDQNGQAYLTARSSGIDGAIGRLLVLVLNAMRNGNWSRLKACRNDTCQWAFYDTSKNRSAVWCAMANCGSRLKARAYRQRHKN